MNASVGRPPRSWQHLLTTEFGAHLAVDGEIGLLSVGALIGADAGRFHERFVALRQAFYKYRAGSYTPAEATALAAWQQFFAQQLNLHPDARLKKFLVSWLGRTHEAFSPAPAAA